MYQSSRQFSGIKVTVTVIHSTSRVLLSTPLNYGHCPLNSELFSKIDAEAVAARDEGFWDSAEMLMEKMVALTENTPPLLKPR